MKKLLLLVIASFAVSACATGGPPKESILLGERSVNFKADHDVIPVGKYQGVFRSLYFVVEKNSIEIFNIVVTYGNGEKQKFTTRLIFGEGSRSRILPFDGGKRRIMNIAFTYKTVGNWEGGKARVVVYGVK